MSQSDRLEKKLVNETIQDLESSKDRAELHQKLLDLSNKPHGQTLISKVWMALFPNRRFGGVGPAMAATMYQMAQDIKNHYFPGEPDPVEEDSWPDD